MSAPLTKTPQKTLSPREFISIWILAWPVMINVGSHTLFSVVDLYWVHTLGTEAIAAVALDGNIIFCMFALTQIIYVGTLAIAARRVGEGSLRGTQGVAGIAIQSFQLALLLGLIIAGIGALLCSSIIGLFEVNPVMSQHAEDYLLPMLWSFLPLFPFMALSAIFTASGDTRTPMVIGVFTNLVNFVLNPFLIFGWAGFPELGVAGAGIASLICQILALVLGILAYFYRLQPVLKFKLWNLQGTAHWIRILQIGIPSGAAAITRPLSTLFLLKVIATFGAEGVAAFGITIRALSIIWIYQSALSAAVSTLTGQSLGRKDLAGIQVLSRNAILISLLVNVLISLVYFLYAEPILRIFEEQNELVISLGVLFLKLLVFANFFSAPVIVWGAILMGAGETRSPMVIALVANWIVKLPLAWFLGITLDWGIEGIWYAMFVSIVFEDLAIYLAYRKGKWRSTRL